MANTLTLDVNHLSEHDSESDDDEVVETSPCGRWEKHKKQVEYTNISLLFIIL